MRIPAFKSIHYEIFQLRPDWWRGDVARLLSLIIIWYRFDSISLIKVFILFLLFFPFLSFFTSFLFSIRILLVVRFCFDGYIPRNVVYLPWLVVSTRSRRGTSLYTNIYAERQTERINTIRYTLTNTSATHKQETNYSFPSSTTHRQYLNADPISQLSTSSG